MRHESAQASLKYTMLTSGYLWNFNDVGVVIMSGLPLYLGASLPGLLKLAWLGYEWWHKR